MLKNQKIEYSEDNLTFEAYYAYDDQWSGKRPGILIAHDWSGKNEFACRKADRLAELGYVGFALDMFGKGKLGKTKEEKTALIQPLIQDRKKLLKRILAAWTTLKTIDQVESSKTGAIGFCFGGLCVLDLARSGAGVQGVVSFHGLLMPPNNDINQQIKSKILVLHGYDDPMVKHEQILAFGDEMTKAKANWEMNIYGNAMHAFTNPEANDPGFGTVYDKKTDVRSWIAMQTFFTEVFG